MGITNDVYRLKGIGPKYTQMLEQVGVASIKELGHRNATSLKKIIETRRGPVVGLSVSRLQGWIDQARTWNPSPVAEPGEAIAGSAPVADAASDPQDAIAGEPGTGHAQAASRFRYLPDADLPRDAPVVADVAEEAALAERSPTSGPVSSLPEINESVVRAMFQAWAGSDEALLNALVAEDVVFRIAGEEPYLGREAAFGRWDRQDELLEDVDYEAELRDVSATDEHVFTYVETWGKMPGTGRSFNYTTVTVYRVRDGQIVEVRPHVHDLDAYDEFWSSLSPGPQETQRGVPAGGYSPGQPASNPRHPGGFQRFRR